MERLLGVAHDLSEKIESNESAAGELLRQCESLQEELKSMRQYRECVRVIHGGEEGERVKLPNIEFSYIKQLQQDNSELRTLLEEHQAALEMIMSKYREQVGQFMSAKVEEVSLTENHLEEELQHRTDQVYNMAAIMYKAAIIEDSSSQQTLEQVTKLEYENQHLRELLQFSTSMMEPNERVQPAREPNERVQPNAQLPSQPTAQTGLGPGLVGSDSSTNARGISTVDSLTMISMERDPPSMSEPLHPPTTTPIHHPTTNSLQHVDPERTLVQGPGGGGDESGDSRSSTPQAEDPPPSTVGSVR